MSGALLTGVQRRSLLPVLQELLSDRSFAPLGSGPLSQADILGACLGLAFFAIDSGPRSWSFAHIPATRNKTPDIFAVADDGSVWLVELKAIAPSDAEVDHGGELDTCRRISAQRARAEQQLSGARLPARLGPRIRIVGPRASLAVPIDGRALVLTVIPRAGLVGGPDVLGPGMNGCARSRGRYLRCTEECLSGAYLRSPTCIVTLIGKDAFIAPPTTPTSPLPPPPLVGTLRVLNGALWAGSSFLANKGLDRLAHAMEGVSSHRQEAFVRSPGSAYARRDSSPKERPGFG